MYNHDSNLSAKILIAMEDHLLTQIKDYLFRDAVLQWSKILFLVSGQIKLYNIF